MNNDDTKLKIVRLIEPSLCTGCRFSTNATVEMWDGSAKRMLHCKRLDCDNWQTEPAGDAPRSLFEEL